MALCLMTHVAHTPSYARPLVGEGPQPPPRHQDCAGEGGPGGLALYAGKHQVHYQARGLPLRDLVPAPPAWTLARRERDSVASGLWAASYGGAAAAERPQPAAVRGSLSPTPPSQHASAAMTRPAGATEPCPGINGGSPQWLPMTEGG